MTGKHLPTLRFRVTVAAFAVAVLALLAGSAAYAAPANDNFPGIDLTGSPLPINVQVDSTGATKQAGEPNHAGFPGGASVWWTWQPPAPGNYVISTAGSSFDTLLGVYAGNTVVTLTTIVSNDDYGGTRQSQVVLNVPVVTTYRIAVDGYSGATGTVKLGITVAPPPPANDNFPNATSLSGALPITVSGPAATNAFATKEASEPYHAGNAGGASVWWKWTSAGPAKITISTAGSNFDTLLAVYTWNNGSPPFPANVTLVASNDQFGGTNQSQVTFNAAAATYYIAVDGFMGSAGNIKLTVRLAAAPGNDDLVGLPATYQLTAVLPISVTGSNIEATHERAGASPEPNHAANAGIASVWWTWTAPAGFNGKVTVTTEGSNFDTLLAVYQGTGYPSLLLAENNNFGAVITSQTSFNAVAGTTYSIAVDGYSFAWTNTGYIKLLLVQAPANDDFSDATPITGALPVTVSGVNRFASKESVPDSEPNHAGMLGGSSVWWYWDAPGNITATVSTEGSNFDTLLAVYTRAGAVPPFANLNPPVNQNDNYSVLTNTSQVTFDATGGVRYYIAVDGQSAVSGYIVLTVAEAPGNAFPIYFDLGNALPTSASGTNRYASVAGQPLYPDYPAVVGGSSVWWGWTAPADGTVTISTEGSDFNTLLTVYPAPSWPTAIAWNDDVGYATTSKVSFPAVSGTLYYIAVDGWNALYGNITLNISGPPDNDDIANAFPITDPLPATTTGSNRYASREPLEPYHAFNNGGTSVWWSWQATSDGKVTVTTDGSDFNTVLAVYTGNTMSTLSKVIAENDDFAGLPTSQVTFFAVSSTTYMIVVDGSFGQSGNVMLTVASPPANDDFDKATALASALPASATGSNQNASREGGEPEFLVEYGGGSVWWSWTAPSSGKVVVSTLDSDFNTVLAVYSGAPISVANYLAGNNDYNNQVTSQLTFNAVAGTVYHIAVDGLAGRWGNISLDLRAASAPVNDDFANAIALTGALPICTTGSNVDASKEALEPQHAGNAGGTSVWWYWTAPSGFNGKVAVSTSGSSFRTVLAVYVGTSVVALTPIAQSDDGQASFSAIANTTYMIVVDGLGGAAGDIILSLAPKPANDDFANAIVLPNALPVSTTGTNVGASKETSVPTQGFSPTEPDHAGNSGGASVWWSFTPVNTEYVTISTYGSDFDTLLAVYESTGMMLMSVLNGSNNDFIERTSQVDIEVEAGTTYYIAVDGSNDGTGARTGNIALAIRPFANPDLEITAITHSPATPNPTQSVTFTVTVRNNSAADAGFLEIGLFTNRVPEPTIDLPADQTRTLSVVPANSSADVTFTILSAPAAGDYIAWAYADHSDNIVESNEGNNAGPMPSGYAWSVKPSPPVISSSASPPPGQVGSAFTYAITASNSPTSYAATNPPPGLSVDPATGVVSGTPTSSGTYSMSVTATNAGGASSPVAVTVTISPPPQPEITSPTSAPGTVGLAFSYTITATNSPNAFAATGLPAGLSVDTATGVISGTPTTAGSSSVTLTASTALGASGSATVSISIVAAPPTVTSALTATGVQDTAFSYTITATGTTPIIYSASNLPSGLTISGDQITGTPTVYGTYVVSLTATNSAGSDTQALVITLGNPTDNDNDGFSNELEIAVGTDPNSAAATPFAENKPAGTAQPMGITSFKLKLDFSGKANADAIGLSGFLPSSLAPASQTMVVDIGGIVKVFALDAKGSSPKGNESIKVTSKSGKISFKEKLSKGSYASALADEGLTVEDSQGEKKIKTVVVTVLYDNTLFKKEQFVEFAAQAGKSGSAKGIGTEGSSMALPGR